MSKADKPEQQMPVERGREEPFLRRWSRRKHEVRAQEAAEPRVEVQSAGPPQPPEKVLTDADMPPLESLNENSDFSLFMSSGVSEALRQRALRKLFTLPSINQRCPLDSEWYDAKGCELLGDTITYDMREAMEREALKLKETAMEALAENKPAAAGTVAALPAQDEVAPAPATGAADRPAAADAGKTLPAEKTRKRRARKEKTA